MKIEDVAYAVAGKTLAILEEKYHYRIPVEHKRDVQRTVQERLTEILAAPSEPTDESQAEGEEAE